MSHAWLTVSVEQGRYSGAKEFYIEHRSANIITKPMGFYSTTFYLSTEKMMISCMVLITSQCNRSNQMYIEVTTKTVCGLLPLFLHFAPGPEVPGWGM